MTPIFEGEQRPGHDAIFWEHEGNRAVRQGDWKIVARYGREESRDGEWELYDLEADRTDMNNLAEANPDKVAELAGLYDEWAKRAGVVPWR